MEMPPILFAHIFFKPCGPIVPMNHMVDKGTLRYIYALTGATDISQDHPVDGILMLQVLTRRAKEMHPTAPMRVPLRFHSKAPHPMSIFFTITEGVLMIATAHQ